MSRLMTKPTKWHVHPPKTQISLGICLVWSVFAVCVKKHWILSYPKSTQQRLWLDWVDSQADQSLCCAHKSFCWFCHTAAQLTIVLGHSKTVKTQISLHVGAVWSVFAGYFMDRKGLKASCRLLCINAGWCETSMGAFCKFCCGPAQ